MTVKGLKRLTLRLTPDHPIFGLDVEPLQRAKIARSWLDTGARISSMEARISGMEKLLAELKEMLSKGAAPRLHQESPAMKDDNGFDPVAFGKNIEDMFS